jgi:hypothetical protein
MLVARQDMEMVLHVFTSRDDLFGILFGLAGLYHGSQSCIVSWNMSWNNVLRAFWATRRHHLTRLAASLVRKAQVIKSRQEFLSLPLLEETNRQFHCSLSLRTANGQSQPYARQSTSFKTWASKVRAYQLCR